MIKTYLPSDISLIDLAGFAAARGYRLYSDRSGNITFRPTATNIGREKMSKNRFQRFKGVTTP